MNTKLLYFSEVYKPLDPVGVAKLAGYLRNSTRDGCLITPELRLRYNPPKSHIYRRL